jgi:hypothetical protein
MALIPPLIDAMFDEARRSWPRRSTASDGAIGDPRHQAAGGDHVAGARGYVHAIDLTHDPAHGFNSWVQANRIRNRILAKTENRVKYIVSHDYSIGHDVIASPNSGWMWRLLNNPNDGPRAHASHLHISILSEPWVEKSTAKMFIASAERPNRQLIEEEDDMFFIQPGRTVDPARPAGAILDKQADVLVLVNGASVRGDVATPFGFRVWKIPSELPARTARQLPDSTVQADKGVQVIDTRFRGYSALWS